MPRDDVDSSSGAIVILCVVSPVPSARRSRVARSEEGEGRAKQKVYETDDKYFHNSSVASIQ